MARNSRMNRAWSDDEDTAYDVADKRRRERERRNGRRNTHRQLDNSVFVPDASADAEHLSLAAQMDQFYR